MRGGVPPLSYVPFYLTRLQLFAHCFTRWTPLLCLWKCRRRKRENASVGIRITAIQLGISHIATKLRFGVQKVVVSILTAATDIVNNCVSL
jgi:hypothetical protein